MVVLTVGQDKSASKAISDDRSGKPAVFYFKQLLHLKESFIRSHNKCNPESMNYTVDNFQRTLECHLKTTHVHSRMLSRDHQTSGTWY